MRRGAERTTQCATGVAPGWCAKLPGSQGPGQSGRPYKSIGRTGPVLAEPLVGLAYPFVGRRLPRPHADTSRPLVDHSHTSY
jgi:hypothetical protein